MLRDTSFFYLPPNIIANSRMVDGVILLIMKIFFQTIIFIMQENLYVTQVLNV